MRVQNYAGSPVKVTVAESAAQTDTGYVCVICRTADSMSDEAERRAGLGDT